MGVNANVAPPLADLSLRDAVLAILSMAAVEGTTRVRLTEFYKAFAGVVDNHRDMFPPMLFTRNAYSVYSKRLDDAVQSLVGYSIELPNPELQHLEVAVDAAERHLGRLRDRYTADKINRLKPLVAEFLKSVGESADR